MRIVLEIIDDETRCIVEVVSLDVELAKLGVAEVPDNEWLWNDELSEPGRKYLTNQHPRLTGTKTFRIRTPSNIDALSYKSHTDRELIMMLLGEKPMAMFYFADGETFDDICDQPFDKYVKQGRFKQYDFSVEEPAGHVRLHYRIFTLPNESWRANAIELLKRVGEISRWSEGMERMEGTLLGYTAAQNDEFIEKVFRARD